MPQCCLRYARNILFQTQAGAKQQQIAIVFRKMSDAQINIK